MKKIKNLIAFALLLNIIFFGACTQGEQIITDEEFLIEERFALDNVVKDSNSDDVNDLNDIQIEGPDATNFSAKIIIDWFNLIKTLTRETEGYTPPVAARAFGYTGLALYESLAPGIPYKKSLSRKLNGFKIRINAKDGAYYWPAIANAALAKTTMHFYKNTSEQKLSEINALYNAYKTELEHSTTIAIYNRSIKLAEMVVEEILEYAAADGAYDAQYHNFPTDFVLPEGERFWQPTPPDYTPALQPYWGNNRAFINDNVMRSQPQRPVRFSTETNSLFYQRAMEVYETVNNLTEEQKIIAEFWADDPVTTATPPGHSISILNQLLQENDSNLAFAAEAYVKLGIAISDAFISCWKTKYKTMVVRPVTYIQNNIDADWMPVLGTPPFPEYTSGHSVQSGALATILTDMFGENYEFTDYTHAERTDIDGSPRVFSNFYEMAEEAAISRLYGGIHYDEAIYLGLEQGYKIGEIVNRLNL